MINLRKAWSMILVVCGLLCCVANGGCPNPPVSLRGKYFFVPDDQLNADSASSYCSSFNARLASLQNKDSTATILSLANRLFLTGLQDVWVSNLLSQYRYSKDSSLTTHSTDGSYPITWLARDVPVRRFRLYNKRTREYAAKIVFCKVEGMPEGVAFKYDLKWHLKLNACPKNWDHDFTMYGGLAGTPGTYLLNAFINDVGTTGLTTSENGRGLLPNYKTKDANFFIPDINFFIGARSEVNQTSWFWSDGSSVTNSAFLPTNLNSCRQMALHLNTDNTWKNSPKDCADERAYFVCETRFLVKANSLVCSGNNILVTWNFNEEILISENRNLFVKVLINGTSHLSNVTDGSMIIDGLRPRVEYEIQATLSSQDCDSFEMSSYTTATTGYDTPDPIYFAWVTNETNLSTTHCIVGWKRNALNKNVKQYLISGFDLDSQQQVLGVNVSFPEHMANKSESTLSKLINFTEVSRDNITVGFQIVPYLCGAKGVPVLANGSCYIPPTPDSVPSSLQTSNRTFIIILGVVIPLGGIVLIAVIAIVKRRLMSSRNAKEISSTNENQADILSATTSFQRTLPQTPQQNDSAEISTNTTYANTGPCEIVSGRKIAISDFEKEYFRKSIENNKLFTEEFKWIKDVSPRKPYNMSVREENVKKSRYKNVYPYDDSRVILTGDSANDYINASFVEGYKDKQMFIATQGPKMTTTSDFWRMVWEQKSTIIVMLCAIKEKEKAKCIRYWSGVGMARHFGDFKIYTKAEEQCWGIVKRTIMLSTTDSKERRRVTQFHMTSWPDFGVPNTTTTMMFLHRMVMEVSAESNVFPIIVHCSAGVGRTGTFIAMSILFDEMEESQELDVGEVILKMRECRKDMVQTVTQYAFLHKLVAERYLFKSTDVPAFEIPHRTSQENWKEKVENEFRHLSRMMNEHSTEVAAKNNDLNNDPACVPYDSNIVSLIGNNSSTFIYINASSIVTPGSSLQIISAQEPTKESESTFWMMVMERKPSCMVSLEEKDFDGIHNADQEAMLIFGEYKVEITLKDENDGYVERTIVVYNKDNLSVTLKHFHLGGWRKYSQPPSTTALSNVIETVRASTSDDDASILVYCRNGCIKSGTFIALFHLAERVKAENRVDVFRTVRDLREYRPNMVNDQSLYEYCYTFAAQYAGLKQDVYVNLM